MNQEPFSVTMRLEDGYRFLVDFQQEGVPPLLVDEPPPLGEGEGPSAALLLAAAVGNCMSASLKYCLERARIEVMGMETQVEGTMERNERGRLRISALRVQLAPQVKSEESQRLERCTEIFEDFCIVGQSVRQGIWLGVEISPAVVEPSAPSG